LIITINSAMSTATGCGLGGWHLFASP
jgi:hypothetical protein